MQKYVKLPNGKVVPADNNGFVSTIIEIELSVFVDNDLEGLLDILSEEATGTELLTNISYSVVGHRGNTLSIEVTGGTDMMEAEEVDLNDLPVIEFEVQVTRIGYGARTVRLSARTAQEAEEIADDDAGNHLYSEHCSEYVLEVYPT